MTRTGWFRDHEIIDRLKTRVHDLVEKDVFEFMSTLYRVTKITDDQIIYKGIDEYTISHVFGKNSQRLVYKIFLK